MQPAAEPVSHIFQNDGLALHYLDWGPADADPVILLHGTRDHARSWDAVAQALSTQHRVIALDLRGHGDSQWSADGAYMALYSVGDLAALIDHLGCERVSLVGHSFSGRIVSCLAAIFPDRVDRLAVVDGFGPLPDHYTAWDKEGPAKRTGEWIAQRRANDARPPRRLASIEEGVAKMAKGNPGFAADLVAHMAIHGMRPDGDGYVWKFDPRVSFFAPEDFAVRITEYWPQISAPTLLCYGAQSWSAFADGDGRPSLLQTHRIAAIEGAGHWPHHDQYAAFIDVLRDFLDG